MRKILLSFLFLLSGCVTVANYQMTCFDQNDKFDKAVQCIKTKINADPRSKFPANASSINEFVNGMDLVADKVKREKISYNEGKLIIANKISELEARETQRNQNQQLLNALTAPQYQTPQNQMPKTYNTSCHAVGSFLNCTTQ